MLKIFALKFHKKEVTFKECKEEGSGSDVWPAYGGSANLFYS
jgi:hypothetical protein